MKVVLLGYMASGKTTIGKFLSDRTYLPFIDLDDYIEEQEKKNIANIFKEDGEIYFRIKEHEYLKELLSSKDNFILSLGGGTPCYANNMEVLLNSNAKSIYLEASLQLLVNRLQCQREKRPLVAEFSDDKLQEFIAKHLFERRPFYQQANYKIKVDGKNLPKIITEINKLLH